MREKECVIDEPTTSSSIGNSRFSVYSGFLGARKRMCDWWALLAILDSVSILESKFYIQHNDFRILNSRILVDTESRILKIKNCLNARSTSPNVELIPE